MAAQRPKIRDFFFPANSPIRQMFETLFPDPDSARQFEQSIAQLDFKVAPAEPADPFESTEPSSPPAVPEAQVVRELPADAIPNGYRAWQEDEHKRFLESAAREWLQQYAPGIYIDLDEHFQQSLDAYQNEYQLTSREEALGHWVSQLPTELDRLAELKNRWNELTEREKEVTALYCMGHSQEAIVHELFDITSVSTIKTHLTNARSKFGLKRIEHLRHMLGDMDFSAYDKHYDP